VSFRSFAGVVLLFFFFSSRRRHTRFSRDWSSDVCSSDLGHDQTAQRRGDRGNSRLDVGGVGEDDGVRTQTVAVGLQEAGKVAGRSEERRVGKECRAGWAASECEEKGREG